MKICSKCGIEKDLILFGKDLSRKDGLNVYCKDCIKIITHNRKEDKKKYDKEYRINNIEKIILYEQTHKEERKLKNHRWHINNIEYANKISSDYNKDHRTQINNIRNERRKEDINYKLCCVLRERLKQALKNDYKSGSAVRDLGCSIEEFKRFIESKWKPGMLWENYGKNGWHIDHIIALANFDLTDRVQFLKACHYTNLQPLWAKENWSKNKY